MTAEDLAERASARLAAWAAGLGPLRASFDALCRGSGRDADRGARVYLDPGSPPLLPLPLWLGEGLPDEVLVDLGASALAGYLHVRVLDDRFDEGLGEPETALSLSSALLAAHHAWAAPYARDARYHALALERWTGFAQAMLEERELASGRIPWSEAAFERVLDRSRPIVLPGAAALAARRRWEDVPALHRWADAVVRAHQRFEDLRDATADRAAARVTWIGARAGDDLAGWLLRGGMDTEIAASTLDLDAARGLGVEADAWVDARIGAMQTWRRELVGRVLGAALAGSISGTRQMR